MRITFSTGNDHFTGIWGFVARVIVMTLATILADLILPGVSFDRFSSAIITAIVIALLNNFIRPILIVVTLPFTIFSMGLFLLFINALIILLADGLVGSFHVNSFGSAFLFSLLLTLFNYLLELPNRTLHRKQYSEKKDTNQFPKEDDDQDFTPYEEVE